MAQIIPLFPLQTVLFPGMPLRLHIFEDRYKELVRRCTASGEPFGVALIRHGGEALGPLPEPHSIGCTAIISQIEQLPMNQSRLLAIGSERFRILKLHREQAYFEASVETVPVRGSRDARLADLADNLRPRMLRYLDLLQEAGLGQVNPESLPKDPLALGYLAAALVNAPMIQKQALLDADEASSFLDQLIDLYQRENALFAALMDRAQPEDNGPFALN